MGKFAVLTLALLALFFGCGKKAPPPAAQVFEDIVGPYLPCDVEAEVAAVKVDPLATTPEKKKGAPRLRKSIHQRVRPYMALFKAAYERLRESAPAARGTIAFRYYILPDGSACSVTITKSDFAPHRAFEVELLKLLSKIHYDPIPQGVVSVEYPFLFAPGG